MDWIQGMRGAIDYMEEHLTEPADFTRIAREAGSSPFHFMRMFEILTGMTVGEYLRRRRLTLAGQELSMSGAKVIDVALRYGYSTPEAFTRAFRRFHGISPSAARAPGANLRSIGKLSIQITLKGDCVLNYKLIEKEAFTVVGKKLRVSCKDGENYRVIPQFCAKCSQDGTFDYLQPLADKSIGALGICTNFSEQTDDFDYYCAAEHDGSQIPDGMETLAVPKRTWAVFESVGPMPGAIQDVWKRIFSEWFPSSGYEHADGPELEVYEKGDMSAPDYHSAVWIPVVKKA
ncbi:AraC family transcriptional regulator [Caproicibacter fermentans]|uniref:AraC family transcriptional regulator n=1 Tax=Caproicibacter fermentans TaxID=2576756 RepID=A0A7G8T7E5_9FIRM|nr:AraC family transcriptional regulator [Caproicibacter fermentans]QNK39536.1 AraC family transcriptional regulator [Caproicibacter fermentans]